MKKLAIFSLVLAFVFAVSCSKDEDDPLAGWTPNTGQEETEGDEEITEDETGGESAEEPEIEVEEPVVEAPAPIEVGNRVVAHRCGSNEAGTSNYPDNSRAALQYTIGLGAYAAECDIYITSDNEIVVAHAENGCEINGLLTYEHTLAELRAAGKLANGEELPNLQEFLEIVLEGGVSKLVLDVKIIQIDGSSTTESREKSACAAERACEIIKEMNAANFCEFIVTSSTGKTQTNGGGTIMDRTLAAASAIGCPAAWMSYSAPTDYIFSGYTWANIETTNFYYQGVDQNPKYKIEDYLDNGIELSVYNVDTDADVEYYLQYKDRLREICTNYPSKLMAKW